MTLREFSGRLGVRHSAIVKWENTRDYFALITWGIEKDIRLYILDRLCRSNKDFRDGYKALEEIYQSVETNVESNAKIQPLKIEIYDGHLQMAG